MHVRGGEGGGGGCGEPVHWFKESWLCVQLSIVMQTQQGRLVLPQAEAW